MNKSLYQIVYISKNDISNDDDLMRSELNQIIKTSQKNNKINNVTGALLFNYRWFAQILEGAHDDIQDTFERIQCDARHSEVVILDLSPIDTRLCANWSMAYLDDNTDAYKEFNVLTSKTDFNPNLLSSNKIFQLAKDQLLDTAA